MKVIARNPPALLIAAALTSACAIGLPNNVALAQSAPAADGSILPFPPMPSASIAAETLQESKHQRRVEPNHLPAGAPNIVIILLDDVGFGLPETFGVPFIRRRLQGSPTRVLAIIPFTPPRSALLHARLC